MSAPTSFPRLSPVGHLLDRSGACWREAEGWRVVASWGDSAAEARAASERAALGDASHLRKIELAGRDFDRHGSALFTMARLPEVGAGARSPSGGAFYRIRPDLLLRLGGTDAEAERLLKPVEETSCLHSVDRTDGLAAFVLAGPHAVDVMARLTSLDLRDRSFSDLRCARAPVARVPVLVARRDRTTGRAYDLVVGREYAAYFWRVLVETGSGFGLVLLGDDARREIEA